MGRPSGSTASETTARTRVREDVRRLILSGDLKPGTRLAQQQLAKRFGVAQSVVRESLLELQFSGLVQSVDNLGIFVSELDTPKLLQAYEVREVLEGLAARHCCQRASRADIRELYSMVERIYALGVEGKLEERGLLDRQFHHKTVLIAQNQILTRLTEAYYVLGMVVQISRPHEQVRAEHEAIVKAIEDDRPEDAERLAREHVAGLRRLIEKMIAEGTYAPQWVVE